MKTESNTGRFFVLGLVTLVALFFGYLIWAPMFSFWPDSDSELVRDYVGTSDFNWETMEFSWGYKMFNYDPRDGETYYDRLIPAGRLLVQRSKSNGILFQYESHLGYIVWIPGIRHFEPYPGVQDDITDFTNCVSHMWCKYSLDEYVAHATEFKFVTYATTGPRPAICDSIEYSRQGRRVFAECVAEDGMKRLIEFDVSNIYPNVRN